MQCPRGLHHEPGLPGTSLARNEDELPYAVLHAGPNAFESRELGAAADPRRQLGCPGPLRRKVQVGSTRSWIHDRDVSDLRRSYLGELAGIAGATTGQAINFRYPSR